MTRRCSHCGHNGHNSRTCPDRGIRLFGVRLTVSRAADCSGIAMRKSASAGNLLLQQPQQQQSAAAEGSTPEHSESGDGYVSDGLIQTSSYARVARKKGVPWSEEEHRLFLVGLHALGKGDWRGISRNYVTSRTPTQVASHAQKYFIRQSNLSKRKRRSSLFDIPPQAMDDGRTSRESRPHLPPLAPHEDKESNSSSSPSSPSPSTDKSRKLWLGISTTSPQSPPVDKLVGPKRDAPAVLGQIDEEPELTRLSLGSANLAAPPTSSCKPISVV